MGQVYLGSDGFITDAYVDALGIAHGGLLTPEMVAWIAHKMSTHWKVRGTVSSGVDLTLDFDFFRAIVRWQSASAVRIGFARVPGTPSTGASYNNLVIEAGTVDTSGGYIYTSDLTLEGTFIAENRAVTNPLLIQGVIRGGGKGFLVTITAAGLAAIVITVDEIYDIN